MITTQNMNETCKTCHGSFIEFDKPKKFIERIGAPMPTLCPRCRSRRRLSFRNERHIYRRKCDMCKKDMISVYEPSKKLTVYCSECWWSDNWDPFLNGKDFDFSRKFFEQFKELYQKIPRLTLLNRNNENSEFNNWTIYLKNCYMLTGARDNEDSYYGHWLWHSKDCVDQAHVTNSELCYECVDCEHSYNLNYSQDCSYCRDGSFLKDCKNCSNCFGCVGLSNAEYNIFNKAYKKEDYEKEAKKLKENFDYKSFEALDKKMPKKLYHGNMIEDCVGDYMLNCKECVACFDIEKSQNCAYGENIMECKDVMDCSCTTLAELCYENLSAVNSYNCNFSIGAWYCHDVFYSESCNNSSNLFGCIGLNKKHYCIINKQYTKEEYEALVPKIIAHMKSTGEYGEFFPMELSPFEYEETIANDYYPKHE